ncbi:MAG: trigger factor [Chromatiales bacterium]
MQVSLNSTGPLERQLTVKVPEEQISVEVQNRLRSISRTARMDGFRPGRAPMKLVEQRYASRVREEVLGEVLRRSFADAVNQEHLRPAGRPVFDPLNAAPGQGLSYTATFEVYPQISINPVGELKIARVSCEVTDADIDKMIETLRKQRRTWTPVERAAQRGDQLTVDFKGTIEGREYAGNAAEDFEIELGAGRFMPGFEEGLIGRAAGEHHFGVSFPADYHHKELAGKKAEFEVKVKSVAEAQLPALDDEFFQAFGVKDGGEEAFRAEVRRNMERERDQAVRNLTKHNALNALMQTNPMQLPRALVEGEAQRLLQEMQQKLMMQGMSAERLGAMKPDAFSQQAERRVGLGLLLGEIIEKNGLKADPARVRATLEQLASTYDDPAAVIKWYYDEDRRLADVRMTVLEEQAVDWLLAQAQVDEQRLAFDDLMNPRQTGEQSQSTER